jgi:hypothetical protein
MMQWHEVTGNNSKMDVLDVSDNNCFLNSNMSASCRVFFIAGLSTLEWAALSLTGQL